MIEQFDFLTRLIALGAALLLLAQVADSAMREGLKLPLIGLVVSGIATLLSAVSLSYRVAPILPWLELLALLVPIFAWQFGRSLFGSRVQLRALLIVAAIILAAWALGSFLQLAGRAPFLLIHAISLGISADLARLAWRGFASDTVQERKPVRIWLPALILAIVSQRFVLEALIAAGLPTAATQFAEALIVIVLFLLLGLALFRGNSEILAQADLPARGAIESEGVAAPEDAPDSSLSTSDL